jgi:TrpR-related protein YerC/YecD
MISKVQKEHSMELYDAILQLRDREECFRFFQDLCSSNELYAIEQRFDVAKLLTEGQVYVDISERTKASSATISRVNRVLNFGTNGLNDILARMQKENEG